MEAAERRSDPVTSLARIATTVDLPSSVNNATHALVVPVPELRGDLVEADGEGEGTNEDGGDEHRVAPEDEVVDLLLQSRFRSQVAITMTKHHSAHVQQSNNMSAFSSRHVHPKSSRCTL